MMRNQGSIEEGPRSPISAYSFSPLRRKRENSRIHRVVADVRMVGVEGKERDGSDLKITHHSKQLRRWKVSSRDAPVDLDEEQKQLSARGWIIVVDDRARLSARSHVMRFTENYIYIFLIKLYESEEIILSDETRAIKHWRN